MRVKAALGRIINHPRGCVLFNMHLTHISHRYLL